MKLNQLPDALPADKYAAVVNIRALKDSDLQTRPGQRRRFTSAAHAITDINSLAALGTDNLPRIYARGTDDTIWLNPTSGTAGINIGTLSTASSVQGAALLPFRPAASPNPYMYIANGVDYKKFSAPDSLNAVAVSNVGLLEPPSAPDAALQPNLNTTASASETLRPTTFDNPTVSPIGSANNAWTNPGDAIDPSGATFASCQTFVAATPNECSCKWYGFAAASFPYTALTLTINGEAILIAGAPTVSDPEMQLRYSIDGGTTWILIAEIIGATAQQDYNVSLPPSTDLTQLQIMAFTVSRSTAIFQIGIEFRVYDIRILGENSIGFFDQTGVAADWTAAGTAGSPSNVSGPGDTATAIFSDPLNPSIYSIAYTNAGAPYPWQTGQTMYQGTEPFLVLDSMRPAIAADISAIYYFTGTTGRCIIVPANLAVGGAPQIVGPAIKANSFLSPSAIAALRRGAILYLNSTEYVYVESVTVGPDNTICIETSTVGTHAAGETITAQPTLIAFGSSAPTLTTMNAPLIQSAITTSTGTLTRTIAFFSDVFSQGGVQDADYLHASLSIDVPTSIQDIQIMFDVGDGSFTEDYFYYAIRASDLSNYISGAVTQIGTLQIAAQRALIDAQNGIIADNRGTTDSGNQLAPGAQRRTEILIPIQSMTRVGTNSQTILDTTKVRIQVICTGNVTLQFGALSTWGGNQPDVGQLGSPYFYRVRPRSKLTGVVGNPSPATRYGVNPLRMGVVVGNLLTTAYTSDTFDTWDIFRYGGSVTSWRYIGSCEANAGQFIDNYSDDAALAGDALDFDNFQPWPSIDLPLNTNDADSTSVATATGTTATVSTNRTNLASYLPGTLVQLAGNNVYTLQTRPTLISGTTYLLQFVENAGYLPSVAINIQEPVIAQRRLPYMWGPDASGTVFGVGDGLRPGNVNFTKNYNPDAVPDSYNIEIVPASEPLLGGEILDGLSFVASPERWFALYPQPDNPAQRYSVVQQPFLRGLAAPYGHCNDGIAIYWWAKDGIYASTKGSLTDADLYDIFPHEGVVGVDITYGATTVHAPDYARCGTFRLTFSNGYLYALYQDTTGTYRCLVLDTIDGGWNLDVYTPAISALFHPSQQAGTLASAAPVRYDELLMGNISGNVCAQEEGQNDDGGAISALVASFEFDGGDTRAPKQWGDFFMDLTPCSSAGVTVTPTSQGANVTAGTLIASSTSRTRQAVSVGGLKISAFMGIVASWIDDYDVQSLPTKLHLWQPSFVILPAEDIEWQTLGSAFGLEGYMHVREIAVAWISTADITLTPGTVDGQAPLPITIPASATYKKQLFPLSANKGQLFNWKASSTAPFQLFFDDFEVHVGQWKRTGEYEKFHGFGGRVKDDAPI